MHQCINASNESTNQSTNQRINESINQRINESMSRQINLTYSLAGWINGETVLSTNVPKANR